MPNLSLGIVDNVADAITRLRYLESKTVDDAALIALLQSQKDSLAQELADVKHNSGVDVFTAQQERDVALKKAADVQAIIETIGGLALSGIRKMKGDEEATRKPTSPPQPLLPSDRRLPEVSPSTPIPPKPSPMDVSRPTLR